MGSRDNHGKAEFGPRRAATIDWLRTTFAEADRRGSKGVVLIAQSDPNLDQQASARGAAAYRTMYEAVRQEVAGYGGEVLFVNGDGHSFKHRAGTAGLANLRWVQVEGDAKVSYVKVRVDVGRREVFTVSSPRGF